VANWGIQVHMIVDRFPHVIAQFASESETLTDVWADLTMKQAKALAPVDTGRLRSEIHVVKIDRWEAEVVSPTEYAPYQEYGTSRNPAHPYMTPAAMDVARFVDFLAGQVYTL